MKPRGERAQQRKKNVAVTQFFRQGSLSKILTAGAGRREGRRVWTNNGRVSKGK